MSRFVARRGSSESQPAGRLPPALASLPAGRVGLAEDTPPAPPDSRSADDAPADELPLSLTGAWPGSRIFGVRSSPVLWSASRSERVSLEPVAESTLA